jgi:hypothetical protein
VNYRMRPPKVNRRRARIKELNPWTEIKVYIPKATLEILKDFSATRQLPVSRLVGYAIDNELDCPEPFKYSCDLPTGEYKEYLHVSEARKILGFLEKLENGTSIDQLLVARRDFGVEDKAKVLGAIRELFEKEFIEEFSPKTMFRNFAANYKHIRPKTVKQKFEPKTANNDESDVTNG